MRILQPPVSNASFRQNTVIIHAIISVRHCHVSLSLHAINSLNSFKICDTVEFDQVGALFAGRLGRGVAVNREPVELSCAGLQDH